MGAGFSCLRMYTVNTPDFSPFEQVSPESVGIPSKTIVAALDHLTDQRVQMHSLLILRQGKLALEAYWSPWERKTLHRMYSVTKSFVSLAIGILVEAGKLKLDDPIIKYFPEKLPGGGIPPQLSAMTIRHMLTMATCHTKTTYKEGAHGDFIGSFKKDWLGSFFTVKPNHDPGSFFIYDTSATHTLGALVEKITSMALIDFLKESFLNEIGVSEDTHILLDNQGTSIGGSGLMMRPIDLLAVLHFLNEGGNERLPSSYIREATGKQIETCFTNSRNSVESSQGYGYQFWRTTHNGWAMLGMGGQMAISIPEKQLCIVTTADTQGSAQADDAIYHAIWNIVDTIENPVIAEDSDARQNLEYKAKGLSLQAVQRQLSENTIQEHINNKTYHLEPNSMGITTAMFSFTSDTGHLTLQKSDKSYHFTFGLGFNTFTELQDPMALSSPAAGSGGWITTNNLGIIIQFLGKELGSLQLEASFSAYRISLCFRLFGELSFTGFTGVASGSTT